MTTVKANNIISLIKDIEKGKMKSTSMSFILSNAVKTDKKSYVIKLTANHRNTILILGSFV